MIIRQLKRPASVLPTPAQLADFRSSAIVESVPVSPVCAHNLLFDLTRRAVTTPAMPFRPAGVVHEALSWVLVTPIKPGAVELRVTVPRIQAIDGKVQVSVDSEVRQSGMLRYRERSTYLALTTSVADGGVHREDLALAADLAPAVDLRTSYGLNKRGMLEIGQAPVLATWQVDIHTGRTWATVSGDTNPIHTSKLVARAFGYRSTIVHGVHSLDWALSVLEIDGSTPAAGTIRFRAPIVTPATVELVHLGGEDLAIVDSRNGRDLVHLRANVGNVRPPLIRLPRVDGKLSSTPVARGILEAALAGGGAEPPRIDNWRKDYGPAIVALSMLDDPAHGPDSARAGLAKAGELELADGRTLSELMPSTEGMSTGDTETIPGTGEHIAELAFPVKGGNLSGDELRRQLAAWHESGALTSGAQDRIELLIDQPELLNLTGRHIGIIGAGAELAPVRFLLSFGADISAVVRPGSASRNRLRNLAVDGAGTLTLSPVGDLTREPEQIAGWLLDQGVEAQLETIYAPGSDFLLATLGADAVMRMVAESSDVLSAWFGSPLDAYALPPEYQPGGNEWQLSTDVEESATDRGAMIGAAFDGLATLQGPNYALAKRLGRWRAVDLEARGQRVSYHIAPISLTNSVIGTKAIRIAHRGMASEGITALEPGTASALMGALFVADLVAFKPTGTDFLIAEGFPSGLWAAGRSAQSVMKRAYVRGLVPRPLSRLASWFSRG